MKIYLTHLAIAFLSTPMNAQLQTTLNLEECQSLAREHYPSIKHAALIQQTEEYNTSNAASGYAPRISINGQATYQSDVTGLPSTSLPMVITPLEKDQYRIYGEVVQPLTGLFTNNHQVQFQKAISVVEREQLEVDLYALTERVNQVYFGLLLIDAQIEQAKTINSEIERAFIKTKVSIEEGSALKMQGDVLQSEMIKFDQKITELEMARQSYMEVLSAFIGKPLTQETTFETPQPIALKENFTRPELQLFEAKKQINTLKNKQVNDANIPQFYLFAQGGYGRPGLNMLSNEFDTYYIAGVKMTWNISNFYTSSRTKEIHSVNSQQIDIQQETFLFNLKLASVQQKANIEKWSTLLVTDDQLIDLKSRIAETARRQLDEGVITSNDYLGYVNAEDQARQNKITHHIQWLLAQYNQQYITGQ